jgi:hypothetical protein
MDNRLIFLYYLLLIMRDEEGYIIQLMETGLNVKDIKKVIKRLLVKT